MSRQSTTLITHHSSLITQERRFGGGDGDPDRAGAKGERLAVGAEEHRRLEGAGAAPAALPAQAPTVEERGTGALELVVERAAAVDVLDDVGHEHRRDLHDDGFGRDGLAARAVDVGGAAGGPEVAILLGRVAELGAVVGPRRATRPGEADGDPRGAGGGRLGGPGAAGGNRPRR